MKRGTSVPPFWPQPYPVLELKAVVHESMQTAPRTTRQLITEAHQSKRGQSIWEPRLGECQVRKVFDISTESLLI